MMRLVVMDLDLTGKSKSDCRAIEKNNRFHLLNRSALMNISNRISFTLGLVGPSFTLDTACSSSGTALDVAHTYIQLGVCDSAIVASSNLILHPNQSYSFGK